jgi:D-alanine-D-alanine ligase-like ATP-grasp enzyme
MQEDVNFTLSGFEDMELSTQIVLREAFLRNLTVDFMDRKNHLLRLSNEHQSVVLKEATKTSLESYTTYILLQDKEATKKILKEQGFSVPVGGCFSDIDEAMRFFFNLDAQRIVIKPATRESGLGISILDCNVSENIVREAFHESISYSTKVIVEEFIPGSEMRFLVVGTEVVGVCQRIPANVVGDGSHSIAELVEIKNRDPKRGHGHRTPLELIRLGPAELAVLKKNGFDLDYVPVSDESIFFRENSNISTGGDSIDATDTVHPSYKSLACRAAKELGALICGVDMILLKPEQPGLGCILELNFNPVLYIHDYPYSGINRQVSKKILDVLGF